MEIAPLHEDFPDPPSSRLRLGLIGLGWAAINCHLPSLRMLRDAGWPVEVAALCDLVPARLQAASRAWPEAVTGDNPATLLDRADLNGVLILTHPDSSGGLLSQAIERGRTTFVEKPVAATFELVRQCAERARVRQVKVQVGYNRRHQPLAIEYARLMKELGPQRHLKVQFWRAARQEPGFYDDTLVHCLDFISQQLGRLEVKRVQVWPADAQTPGLDQGWRIDLGSAHDPRISAEIDIRPAVGRDIECYTVLGLKRSIALQYPHIGTVDGQAALVAYDGGNERVIYRARMTNRETDSKCRHSGFLRQMAEFCQLCAGTLAAPGCGLEAAMEALRIRDEISALIRSDVTLAQIGGRPA